MLSNSLITNTPTIDDQPIRLTDDSIEITRFKEGLSHGENRTKRSAPNRIISNIKVNNDWNNCWYRLGNVIGCISKSISINSIITRYSLQHCESYHQIVNQLAQTQIDGKLIIDENMQKLLLTEHLSSDEIKTLMIESRTRCNPENRKRKNADIVLSSFYEKLQLNKTSEEIYSLTLGIRNGYHRSQQLVHLKEGNINVKNNHLILWNDRWYKLGNVLGTNLKLSSLNEIHISGALDNCSSYEDIIERLFTNAQINSELRDLLLKNDLERTEIKQIMILSRKDQLAPNPSNDDILIGDIEHQAKRMKPNSIENSSSEKSSIYVSGMTFYQNDSNIVEKQCNEKDENTFDSGLIDLDWFY